LIWPLRAFLRLGEEGQYPEREGQLNSIQLRLWREKRREKLESQSDSGKAKLERKGIARKKKKKVPCDILSSKNPPRKVQKQGGSARKKRVKKREGKTSPLQASP